MIGKAFAISAAAVTMVTAAVFPWGAASAKKEPEVLRASTVWNLNYSQDSCRLTRLFGDDDDRVALVIDQYRPGDIFAMTVAGRPVRKLRLGSSPDHVRVTFGPNDEGRDSLAYDGHLGEYKPAALFVSTAFGSSAATDRGEDQVDEGAAGEERAVFDILEQSMTAERAAQIEWLEVERVGSVRLVTGPMDEVVVAMQKCMANLLAQWGIDVEAHRKLSRPLRPANDVGNWIRSSDYPNTAIARGVQGIVRFRLTVDEKGKPIDCAIQGATDPAEFSKMTCDRLMDRARFEPALDAEGNPIKSVFLNSVAFKT